MAHRVGIQPGDRLVSVNTAVLHGLSHSECLDILSRPVTNVCLTLLRRRPADDATSETTSGDSDASSEETTCDERESLPDGHSDGDGDATGSGDEDGDNNVQLVQMSTNSCQSSIDAQLTSGDGCEKCGSVNDAGIGASKCKHNRCYANVLTSVARDHYSTMNSSCDPASEEQISEDIQSARGDSSIFADANNQKHDPRARGAVGQEKPSSLRGNELFAIRDPVVHPWRQQFNVLEGSFIDSNILKQHSNTAQILSVDKDRGDTNRKCHVAKENTTTMQKSCGFIAEDQVVPELPSHGAVMTKMDNAGSTLDDTCLSPVSYDVNTPKYNELIPGINDDDDVFFGNEEIESDADLMRRNRHSETNLKPPALGDTTVIVSPALMSPDASCGTWSTFDESTYDDSYTFGDGLTPGQVRVALTSPFVELELELDSDYDISINSDCTLNEDTSLYPEYRAKSIGNGGACLIAMCPAEDTIDVRRALFSPSDTINALDGDETVHQLHQGAVPAEPSVHPEFKAQKGIAPTATSCDDQMAAAACPLIRSPALFTNHAIAATELHQTPDLTSPADESASLSPASLARRQQQHASLMSEVKAATELCRPSAAWLKPRPLSDCNKGPATDHCLEQQLLMMCGPQTCGGEDSDVSSLRTDWSDSVTVNWMQSENMHKGSIANGADGVVWTDGKDGTDSGYNTEKHHDDVGGRPNLSELLSHHLSGQKLTQQQPSIVLNVQSQSFCQHLPSLSFNGQFGEQRQDDGVMSIVPSVDSFVQLPNLSQDQCADEITPQCSLSMQELGEKENTNESNIYEYASPACNERCILSQSAAKTVDFVPTQCRDSVSHVCVSQDTVTTATVLLQHLFEPSRIYQHCDTVEQGHGSPVSPTVMLRRAHHGTKEGDPQRQRSRLDEHNLQEQGSVKELERQSSQGDSDVTLPLPEIDFPAIDATAVPENRGDSLCNTDTVGEGTGLSVAAGTTIFPHEWQPMTVKPEECPGRSVTQTSGCTSSYDTVASTPVCTVTQQVPLSNQTHVDTSIVSPSNQQRVTSVDNSDPDYSAIGCYPGANLSNDDDQSGDPNLRKSLQPQLWEYDSCPHSIGDSLSECRNEESDGPSVTSPRRHTEMSSSARGWSQPAGCGSRNEDKPFQVQVLRSLLGVGISVSVTPSGVVITGIQKIGPVAKNGSVR